MRRFANVNHYLLMINASYAKGWEKAVRHFEELEKNKKPSKRYGKV
jgi:hypothetical protein